MSVLQKKRKISMRIEIKYCLNPIVKTLKTIIETAGQRDQLLR